MMIIEKLVELQKIIDSKEIISSNNSPNKLYNNIFDKIV
jgi:hypothetical protein